MHVLREIHKALRPGGILLDMHPQPRHPPVEVIHEGGTLAVGRIDWTEDCRDIRRARRRLSEMQTDGFFHLEGQVVFDFAIYHDSVDSWLEYRRRKNETNIVSEELLQNARKAMRRPGAQLVVREKIRATSFRR